MTYQPPVGVWKSSSARSLLWATKQVLLRITRDEPEGRQVADWQRRIKRRLNDPVQDFDWAGWYRENVEGELVLRADPDVPDRIMDEWDRLADEIADGLWVAAAESRAAAEGLPFDPDDLRGGLAEAFKQLKGLSETQRDLLRGIMRRALEAGEGQFGFARRIRQEFPGMATWKSEQLAVTEWNRAASYATHQGIVKRGEQKQWFTAGDNRVCSICETNAGDGEVPAGWEYAHGDTIPPAHPSCRCNISSAGF